MSAVRTYVKEEEEDEKEVLRTTRSSKDIFGSGRKAVATVESH